jgi:hypothetical protein
VAVRGASTASRITAGLVLCLSLALGLASPAAASSQAYVLAPGSLFTPAGGGSEALAGGFDLSLVLGNCQPPPGEQIPCNVSYDFGALAFTSEGLDLELAPAQPIPGLLELSFADLRLSAPDPPELAGLVVERSTLPPQAQHEQRFRDLVLRTSSAGAPDNQLVIDPLGSLPLPSQISFDLELVEIQRLVLFDGIGGSSLRTLSTSVLGTLSLDATPVPEPTSAALLGAGLALLAAALRRAR